MTALPDSAFFSETNLHAWARYDPDAANALLDDMGLTERTRAGLRKLPDGRPMEFVIETAGERQEVENALAIITDTWRELGIKLVMRNRLYAGVSMAGVWFGWDNGLPQPYTPPGYLAPTEQDFMAWPMWGQYYQTRGAAGEPVDMPQAKRLLELSGQWSAATDTETRSDIWREMLEIHASELAIWAWEPGAHFGVHRIDEFWFDLPAQTAQVSE